MRVKLLFVALMGLAAAGMIRVVSAQPKSQWDAVFTDEQAKKGELLFQEHCSHCHGLEANGGESGPSLTGTEFASNWNDLTLGDLVERMRTTMPQSDPGSLSRQQNTDVLAFLLFKGGAPSGTTALQGRLEILNTIKYLAKKP